ncbi:MAG: ABC transporter substrate-binding protein [Firmicutes bacterium]|nr:ABC transporter substrate-binding protein [Bacillota bacterium]
MAGNDQKFMDTVNTQLLPAFEKKYPKIDLQITFVPWETLSVKLATAFAGGMAPDVFMHGAAATAGFAATGRVEPLDSLIAKMPDARDFGSTLEQGNYYGKHYMIPVFGAGRLLMYRADEFKEAGLNPDEPPATWEEFRNAAIKLAIRRGNQIVREGIDLPTSGIDAQQIFACFLWQAGGSFFNRDYTRVTFNDAHGVEALQFLANLIQKDKVADTSINLGQGNVPPIATNQVAMLFAVPGDVAQVKTYAPGIYKEIRVAPPLKNKEQWTFYSFSGMFMSKTSKHKEDAWKVMEFFSSPEALEKINASMGTLPPRRSLAKAPAFASDPNIRAFVESMQYARGNPNIAQWVQIRDILSRYLEQALYGRMTPKAALDQAAKEADALLSNR